MANTKQLPPEVLEVVAQQIGARLGIFPDDPNFFAAEASAAEPSLDLAESFEVWSLPPDALEEVANGLDLPDIARPTGVWHHQIRSNREARSFARSRPLGPTPDSWSVRELFVSSLAEDLSNAIDWVENNVPPNLEVRYLSSPPHQVDAFWLLAEPSSPLFTEWNNRVVIIRAGASSVLNSLEMLSSQDFFRVLQEEDRGAGLR